MWTRRVLPRLGLGLVAVLSALIALASIRFALGVGVQEPVASNHFLPGWFPLHVAAATLALVLGPLQFVSRLRARRPAVHRWIGRAYVLACLAGGASGLMLALGASTGPVSQAGFGLLALLWLATTARGWRLARQGRTDRHREWMIRSFALTFAAVTLRLYIPLTFALGLPLEDAYRAISFLAWVPNLIVAELVILGLARPRRAQAAA